MTTHIKGLLLGAAFVLAAGCDGGSEKKAAPAAGGDGKPAAAAPAAGGKAYDAAKSTASVKFTVKWTGEKPKPQPLLVAGDEVCMQAHAAKPLMNEGFVVNDDGTMPHAFVWASKGPHEGMTGFPAPSAVTLDQKGCTYVPHVFGLRAGQTFSITNSDGTKHNVHSHPKVNKDFNVAQDKGGKNEFVFSAKEKAIPFQCDVHSWMKAYAFVVDHPFFGATDASGSITIGNLPAGEYTFKVWHEQFSGEKAYEQDVKVTVKDGETAAQVVEFK